MSITPVCQYEGRIRALEATLCVAKANAFRAAACAETAPDLRAYGRFLGLKTGCKERGRSFRSRLQAIMRVKKRLQGRNSSRKFRESAPTEQFVLATHDSDRVRRKISVKLQ
jgi:hypothetical protein